MSEQPEPPPNPEPPVETQVNDEETTEGDYGTE